MNEKSSSPVLRGRDGGNTIRLLDGKTQTAIEYAYRYHEEYQAVLWARAESQEALTSSFVEIAGLLELPQKDEQDQTIIVQAVKRWLQDNSRWLLILDNADEPKIVREFLPTKCDGHILLTTRAQALGGLAQRIEVDTFTPELGALFLLRRATIIGADGALDNAVQSDREVAVQISEELGGLALALDQAGAYVEETQCCLADYLSLYRTRRAEMLKERGGLMGDHPDSVATTWSLSFQRVEEKNAAAADLLRLCAFLHPDAIPEEIITTGAEHLGSLLQATANDPLELNKAIAALGSYSLIRRDSAGKTLSIHRLVQAVLRDAMPTEEEKQWAERTVYAVKAAFPRAEFAKWLLCERCLPHALVCAELVEQRDLIFPEAAFLLSNAGQYLYGRAQYSEAEPLWQHALTIMEQLLGPDHPSTATSLNNLALLYKSQGKYAQAEPLYVRALSLREQQLGASHPYTAQSLNNLASLYQSQGKYAQAEPLYVRALSLREQLLGPDHPDTAQSLNNLALLYKNQGTYEQAEPLLIRALLISDQQLGPDHPDTATTLNNLAFLYDNQGKYAQAEPLYVCALSLREQLLGPDHPDTAQSLNNLALLYDSQGKYEQAEPLYVRALLIYEQQLGPDHPDTAQSLNNLAGLYRKQGKYEQAEPLYVRALLIYEQQLGPDHPDTAQSLNNLALLYDNKGKYAQAELLLIHALLIYEQQLGPDHPGTATSLNNLAGLYESQGKYTEAEPLYVRALSIYEKQLGPDHPNTATSLYCLAFMYQHQKKYEQAEPLYQRALSIYEKVLGPQHPHTQQTRQNYATLLRAMNRNEEAKHLEEGNES